MQVINHLSYTGRYNPTTIGEKLNETKTMLKNSLVIKGGRFTIDPSEFVPQGYIAIEESGVWTVSATN